MSDFWHKLGCCVVEKPQPETENVVKTGRPSPREAPHTRPLADSQAQQHSPTAHRGFQISKKKRRRIDRSMIGEPMNFVHLTHIGSGDMAAGDGLPMAGPMQEHMRSKGGRDRQWNNSRIL